MTRSHCVICPGLAALRVGLEMNDIGDMMTFFRKLMIERSKRNKNKDMGLFSGVTRSFADISIIIVMTLALNTDTDTVRQPCSSVKCPPNCRPDGRSGCPASSGCSTARGPRGPRAGGGRRPGGASCGAGTRGTSSLCRAEGRCGLRGLRGQFCVR